PGPWRIASAAALAGALVGEAFVLGINEPFGMPWQLSLLALAPVVLGALWAADHLSRVWDLIREPIPQFVRSPNRHGSREARSVRGLAFRILLGALVRLAAGAAGLVVIGRTLSHHSHV